VALGERGFEALTRFVRELPSKAIDYADTAQAEELVDKLWRSA
jgi:hypothetical protein